MFRLLALLQLTRAALAFTAVADAWTVLLLRSPNEPVPPIGWMITRMLIVSLVSLGLYGFGMSLNDLLDARRDRIFAPRRPIPSGRIHLRTAVQVSLGLLMLSLFAAAALDVVRGLQEQATHVIIPWSFIFAFATAALIVFYNGTAKYLGGIGLLTLGAIRAFHCLVSKPTTPLLFLSMFLLCHVFIVSLIAYRLENKRPRLRRHDLVVSFTGFALLIAAAAWYMDYRGALDRDYVQMLIGPSIALVLYAAWAARTLLRTDLAPRQKGERLMLLGLFWLFMYDASMLFSNQQWLAGTSVVLLFICAVLSFFGIRALNRAIAHPRLSYRVERAEART